LTQSVSNGPIKEVETRCTLSALVEGGAMPAIAAPLPIIRPITDLRTQLNDVCTQATDTQEPVVLTKNGVASYVLMDSDAYEAAERRNRVYLALREAEIEEQYRPEAVSAEESDAKMREIFALWGLDYAPASKER